MSAADVITDLARLGIQLEAHGDRLRYSPRSAVSPDLADRMKALKGELLAMLRADASPCPVCGCPIGWRSGGGVDCANCCPKPDGAEKLVVVHLAGQRLWADYDAELANQRTHRFAQDDCKGRQMTKDTCGDAVR